ncbi:6-phosphofructokinase [Clostridium polynesiense]|uniref:6-phosphofructokinase n=1 Tax=Clostridium polynesiense TaxID=1325933 RepID=UPI00058D501B|nr:6-phosphofructokinase [Clostridium polynesiense]
MPNCIIAQSGGPTSVINASVCGLVFSNSEHKIYDKIYAGINGIEGILEERIIELTSFSRKELDLFKFTPSAGLGSCRYKLKSFDKNEDEYNALINICKKYDINTFFYIGGNDSMDTIFKLSSYAEEKNINIKFIGIPKTIDNDLPVTDHTPGFGSAAKFIATTALETYLDSSVYTNNGIFILETMGRDTGWLAASACLAKLNGQPIADFIYLPEVEFDKDKFLKDTAERFKEKNQVYIVVSEGIKDKDNKFISQLETYQTHDSFGHAQLGGVGTVLKNMIVRAGITSRIKVLELGVMQRCAMHCSSSLDIDEAYKVGYDALIYSKGNNSGNMVAIKRESNTPYKSSTFLVKAARVANNIKYIPLSWINEERNNLNPECQEYFSPLIEGTPALYYENNIPMYKVFNK